MTKVVITVCGAVIVILLSIALLNIIFAENNVKHYENADSYQQHEVKPEIAKKEILSTPKPTDKRIFDAERGDDKLIEKLIREGVDVNQKDKDGITPLHSAVANERRTTRPIIALLKAGADINAQDSLGSTPLLYSLYSFGNSDYSRLLIEYKADVNIARNNGTTPLHEAAGQTNTDILKLLLEKGADPNAVNDRGETPFMLAVRNAQDVDAVRLFIEKGANVHLVNKEGKSAAAQAEEALRKTKSEIGRKKLLEIIQELKKAGAN